MQHQIFISYSRANVKTVSAIFQFLQEHGYSVWFDTHAINLGDDWPEEILKGIKDCKVFVLLITPNSATSQHVKREVYLAGEEKKIILPVIIPPPSQLSDGIRYYLAGIQRIEVNPPIGLEDLVRRIDEAIAAISDVVKIELDRILEILPNTKIRSFFLRDAAKAMLRTLLKEVPRHLIDVLADEQRRYYLEGDLPVHRENALRRLRNHGLLEHDGEWLFTPTRSKRVWATPMGELLIELSGSGDPLQSHRLFRVAHEALERLAIIENQPDAIRTLKAIASKAEVVDSSYRYLRNQSLISYHRLSSKVPFLHELMPDEFYITELGRYVLKTLNRGTSQTANDGNRA